MRLLVITQAVDRDDPVLGFFHRWLEAFSTRFERIEVICLREGTHALPVNVRVHSLGKEHARGALGFLERLRYAARFYVHIRKHRRDYDAVFVHMNPEYILLGGLFWRFMGKRIALWYNHEVGSLALRLAAPLAHIIFHTSPYAFPARYPQAQLMPAGIDTDTFAPQPVARETGSIYFQGRIAPAKNVHLLLAAFAELYAEGKARSLTLVGPEEPTYGAGLRRKFAALIESGAVSFLGPKPNRETPALYSAHEVSVNLTARGNYDKTVLESLACGTPVIAASDAFRDLPGVTFLPELSTEALIHALTAPPPDAGKAPDYVARHHGLSVLAAALSEQLTNKN